MMYAYFSLWESVVYNHLFIFSAYVIDSSWLLVKAQEANWIEISVF